MVRHALYTAIAVVVLTPIGPAAAQRGQTFERIDDIPQSATTDFQGVFDTNLPPPGVVTVAAPSFQVDAGITERWSLGVNLATPGLALAGGSFGFAMRTRYRLIQSMKVSLTLDGRAGIFDSDGDFFLGDLAFGAIISGNLAWRFARKHELQATLAASGLHREGELIQDVIENQEVISLFALGLAIGHVYSPVPWFSFQNTVVALPYVDGTMEDASSFSDLGLNTAPFFDRLMFRSMLYFRAGETWLFEVGAYLVPGAVGFPIPGLACRGGSVDPSYRTGSVVHRRAPSARVREHGPRAPV